MSEKKKGTIEVKLSDKAEDILKQFSISTGIDDWGRLIEEALFTVESCIEKAKNLDKSTRQISSEEFKGLFTVWTRFDRPKGY